MVTEFVNLIHPLITPPEASGFTNLQHIFSLVELLGNAPHLLSCGIEVIMEIYDDDITTISGYDLDWRLVGRRLLVGHSQLLTDIDRQGGSEREKRENMFFTWKRIKTKGATYSALVEALRNLDNNATADRVEALKTKRQQGSSQIPQTMDSSQVDSHNQASAAVNRDGHGPIPNLRDLVNDVASVIPARWRIVGIQLGLSSGTLDGIQSKTAGHPGASTDAFEQVFTEWEKGVSRPYTWNTIVDVLRAPAVGENRLAQSLWDKYLSAPRTLQPPSHVASNGLQHSTNDQDFTDSAGEKPETPMFPVEPDRKTKKISDTIEFSKMSEETAQHVKSVTVIIQACNAKELYASLEEMDTDITKIGLNSGIKLYLGKFGTYQCALVETKQAGRCEKDIKEVLEICKKAKLVIGIGIAAGIGKNQKYGDVLVSTRILHYDQGRVQEDELIPRGETLNVTIQADRVFASTDTTGWEFQCTKEDRKSKWHKGLMVSGPYLVDSERCVRSMKKYCPEAIGYQMEAHVLQNIKGEPEFSHLHVIVIKGISDFAGVDGKKDDRWQYTAAKAAANYAKKSLLESPGVFI